MKRTLAALVATGLAVAVVRAQDAPPRATSRSVELTCRVKVPDRPAAAFEVWVPRPLGQLERDFQKVDEPLSHLQAATTRLETKPAFFHATAAATGSFSFTWIARVERREQKTPPEVLESTASELSPDEKKALAAELAFEKGNEPDAAFRKIAAGIAPGEKAFVKIARAAYDWVVANVRYEKPPGKGWGQGSLAYACSERAGNCTDFHVLFTSLCRARGIPARLAVGISLPPEHRGTIAGYHCWAEFYVPGGHWVPVDASEAWKRPELRTSYFGTLDPDRVLLIRGRDVVLDPPQKGPPVSLMTGPYAETGDGRPVAVMWELSFEDVSTQGK